MMTSQQSMMMKIYMHFFFCKWYQCPHSHIHAFLKSLINSMEASNLKIQILKIKRFKK